MRLPQPLLQSIFFTFERLEDFLLALGDDADQAEVAEINRLVGLSLPPITSHAALATMLGINAGLLQAFERRPEKFYRTFFIPKGRSQRKIQAPRIGLKIIQKWLSVSLAKTYQAPPHVFGFVEGRSHIDAATVHLGAQWLFNTDIESYFESTPKEYVRQSLLDLGYGVFGAGFISDIACYEGALSQGSPLSPLLSNLCFAVLDKKLSNIALEMGLNISRYADDIVFSGSSDSSTIVQDRVRMEFESFPWNLSASKTRIFRLPQRLKVHGLLVHGAEIRLTKGYRNRVRALAHLQRMGKLIKDVPSAHGHLRYAAQIVRRSTSA